MFRGLLPSSINHERLWAWGRGWDHIHLLVGWPQTTLEKGWNKEFLSQGEGSAIICPFFNSAPQRHPRGMLLLGECAIADVWGLWKASLRAVFVQTCKKILAQYTCFKHFLKHFLHFFLK